MALTHSLTHSILINLFIKVELCKHFFHLPPPLSIVFVPNTSQLMFGLFIGVLERSKFLCNKMAEVGKEVEESVEDGFSFDLCTEFLRGLKIAKL